MQIPDESAVIHRSLDGSILRITVDHPPVNAINARVRAGLMSALREAQDNPAIEAVLITGKGRNFIAGADIREFGQPPVPPSLPDVCTRIEECTKPVVVTLQGATLGGGLEIALSAHYRIAMPDARMGLPEVQLGLLPGAGGTQRLPRLVGAGAALSLMLDGHHITASEALKMGLVDQLAEGSEVIKQGLLYTKQLLDLGAPVRRTRDADGLKDIKASQLAIDLAKEDLSKARHAKGLFSPAKIVQAVEAAVQEPFDQGLALERALFLQCMDSPQRAGLVHAFMAERQVSKMPGLSSTQSRPISAVGVVGGGTMGAGIALATLNADLPVVMIERDEQALGRGRAHIEKVYDELFQKGRISADLRARRLSLWQGSTDYGALADVDVVVEAVFEDMGVKKAVFAELDRVCKPGAVLATNTSYLDIDAIAGCTSRPQDVIGLHFFSPAHLMKLLEIVVTSRVSPDVVATAFALAGRLGKVAVRAGICDGFIGNRMLAVCRAAADFMMEDGASPYEIDAAVRDFGFAMGPYQVMDLAGGDIAWAARKRRAASRDPHSRYVHIPDALCERGWFGQKTGRGYYRYEDNSRIGQPDPQVLAIIENERERAAITPRAFSAEQIIRRYMAAMINEGANVIAEGIALRPLDVDVTLMAGYGFPRYRGGPMHYADQVGLPQILADIEAFAAEDPQFWRPSALLVDLVSRQVGFASLNHLDRCH
ncbi:3-hydroxyacyl-CoA dehydrogenase NAD-binding domain-containing protein [Pseudomonas graminis]|uniref:3-hydroxyacyl-CoA dehydrogenase NAD-binding domain-containing protein n=1 Tax=Pseudomonas graminis TaxID=158627 RepID=UPI003C17332E